MAASVVTLFCCGFLAGCMAGPEEVTQSGAGNSGSSGGSGSTTRSWFGDIVTSGRGPIEVSPDAFAAEVYCPPIQLQPGTHLIMKFEQRSEEQPQNLLYQAKIDEWARSCTREGTDQTRIKIGVSGDATTGPAWQGGEVFLPVRVAILPTGDDDAKPLYSEILDVPLTIGAGQPSEAWTVIEDKFLVARNQPMRIIVGYDEGSRRR